MNLHIQGTAHSEEVMHTIGRLLVVDDEVDLLDLLRWQLEKRAYTVFTAESAAAARAILETTAIEVLITDIRMPDMDGLELIRQAVAAFPTLQCIVITGHGEMDSAIAAMRLGAVNYLQKPVGVAALDLAVRNALEKRSLLMAVKEKQDKLEKANQELAALRDQLEQALAAETAGRREAEKQLARERLRQAAVTLLTVCLRCWKQSTRKSKIDFAEESKIWTASVDSGGTYRTRTLDRYLCVRTLPAHPRYTDVLDTAYFVLARCSAHPNLSPTLQSKTEELEKLLMAVTT
jgi:YesN/AraC family two-component response regulator